jgi:tRNA A-37 threonylcarbamoyl transferase component Bud32/tetratricopeptide (TPR) repeat protein
MSTHPEPNEERQRRLDEVSAEIEREIATGATLSASEWARRFPELEPELSIMIASKMGTLGVRPTVETPHGRESSAALIETMQVPASTLADSGTGGSAGRGDSAFVETVPSLPGGSGSQLAQTLSQGTSGQPSAAGLAFEVTAPSEPPPAAASRRDPLGKGEKVRYIGDYVTISVLGQGGMGFVYKARQISLNRLVALKMIRNAEFASDDALRRFQNEAEAVAKLDHPGIVPIYEVGIFEDQRYFSMKLVEGQGALDKLLEKLSKSPKEAARVVAEVADAVHHAHQRGILHRDLKPANILIDAQNHPHVTDFGLAKKIEEDVGLTVTGAVMGTPSYMSPEQAAGRTGQITTASDVYGLGAILYACLTGRAPFVGDSVVDTLERVRNNPPLQPTRVNTKLPRDLEVICLKCLEKEPRHRYPTAQAVADDLNRWLRGEPIAARPVSAATRLVMWAKRKPALAGLSAALILVAIGGVAGIAYQWREAVYQRDQATQSRDVAVREEKAAREAEGEAKTARNAAVESETAAKASEKAAVAARAQADQNAQVAAREAAAARKAEGEAKVARDDAIASEKVAVAARAKAETNAQIAGQQATLALFTIQDLIARVTSGMQEPGLFDLKQAILDAALKRVNDVAGVYDKVETSQEATTAAAYMQFSKIYRQLGQTEKAFQALQKCLAITKQRVIIKKGSDPSRQNLANTYFELAQMSEELRRDMKAALTYSEDGLKLYYEIYAHPMKEDHPLDRKIVRAGLAEAYTRVGVSQYRIGELTAALENYRKAYNLRRELVDEIKDNPQLKQDLSYSVMAIAETSFRLGDRTLADEYYRKVIEQREAMFAEKPKDMQITKELGDAYYMAGEFKLRGGDFAAARGYLEKSREKRLSLVTKEPLNVFFQRDLGMVLYRRGNLADLEKNREGAAREFAATLKIRKDLAVRSEHNDRRQAELMLALAHAGDTRGAIELADGFSAGPNVDRELRTDLARGYAQIAAATPADQAERVQTALVKSVDAVRIAIKEGFRDRVYLETEPDLLPIRDRNDFKQLLDEIRPANAPAGGNAAR